MFFGEVGFGDCSADSLDISVNAFFVPVGNESS